jgi:hypothetical protein
VFGQLFEDLPSLRQKFFDDLPPLNPTSERRNVPNLGVASPGRRIQMIKFKLGRKNFAGLANDR